MKKIKKIIAGLLICLLTALLTSVVDIAGNEGAKNSLGFTTADNTPPTVTIFSPTSGTETDRPVILVEGTCDDLNAVVKIRATGLAEQALSLEVDGSFSYAVPLVEGTNTIQVTAVDEAGNWGTDVVTVERSVQPPLPDFELPKIWI